MSSRASVSGSSLVNRMEAAAALGCPPAPNLLARVGGVFRLMFVARLMMMVCCLLGLLLATVKYFVSICLAFDAGVGVVVVVGWRS